MPTLPTDLRNKLERTCIAARNLAERAATDALKSLAVAHHEPFGHMSVEQRNLRNKLRARARQLGDVQDAKGQLSLLHLAQECAYEHWHRMLFARFLAENNLLIESDMGVPVSLDEVKELAKEAKTNLWALAGRYAQTMLPEIFRSDDPVLQFALAREDQLKLEELLDGLAKETFTASDSLGWCYQFWQAERKDQVNAAGNKIGAEELPSVTQLFTEDYIVDFLLDNTLGAWWAGKDLATSSTLAISAKGEEELRKAISLADVPWKYLRFVSSKDGKWTPAAGTFDGWPKTAKELKCLDPCCGSGHFIVGMFDRLVALRMTEEKMDEKAAVAAVITDNLFGLELDPRCTQIGAFSVALAAWRRVGYCALPSMHIACSGLAPNTRETDWLKLAGDNEKLQRGMARLYRLFQNAPVLGSLINPRAGKGDLLEAGFHELRPLLAKALAQEAKDDSAYEMAVTAQGITKAAEILAGQFTLVATNVPYLARGKQDEVLKDYCERVHPESKADIATCFIERCLDFCASGESISLVTPQNWLFLGAYTKFRERLLSEESWNLMARLGENGFESSQAAGAFTALFAVTRARPPKSHNFFGIDVSDKKTPVEKNGELRVSQLAFLNQYDQRANPDARVSLERKSEHPLLELLADCYQGISPADFPHFGRAFWEVPISPEWRLWQSTVDDTEDYGGRVRALWWSNDFLRAVDEGSAYIRGEASWDKLGVAVSAMRDLPCTLYLGEPSDTNVAIIIPKKNELLPAIWCFCCSPDYNRSVRAIDQALKVTNATLVKVPFDLAHWQRVAAEKYPNGLPKPFSSDPTQWLFSGHPKGSTPWGVGLQVAVARLLGYRWPRQMGSSFPDCPAIGLDGLEKLSDDDGIVCIPSVRGDSPATEQLRTLLVTAFGEDWKASTEVELLRASGSQAGDLDEWLRNEFFQQHCNVFHQRPFVWHIWDGRKRDGFHALINYHKLAAGDRGRRTLENLTHSYLGDWITRQKDGMKRGEEGADERLVAAQALKERLEAIIEGEGDPGRGTGFDIFVRWKPLSKQAIGWKPDINDGVRMNIRPFVAADIPGGKKGAGVLRVKPNIKWDKDRGKEPQRDKKDFPWFWNGTEFTGDRVNDVHLTRKQKEEARADNDRRQ